MPEEIIVEGLEALGPPESWIRDQFREFITLKRAELQKRETEVATPSVAKADKPAAEA